MFSNWHISCCKGNKFASSSIHPHPRSQLGSSWHFGTDFLCPSTSFSPPSAYVSYLRPLVSFNLSPTRHLQGGHKDRHQKLFGCVLISINHSLCILTFVCGLYGHPMEGTLQMLVGNLMGFAIKQAEFDTWFPRLPPVWLWVSPG